MKSRIALALLLVLCVLLSSCAAGTNTSVDTPRENGGKAAGFWLGAWNGVITPVTFVISLFSRTTQIYEVHNNGGWYDFGFLLGVSIIFGGGGGGAARARRRG